MLRWTRSFTTLGIAVALLAACGGGRESTTLGPLQPPRSAVLADAQCDTPAGATPRVGPLGQRRVDGQCLRTLAVLDDPAPAVGRRLRALATAPTRIVTAAELMDWAEVEYRVYFPGTKPTRRLDPYVYRYYPETDNHLAVTGEGRIFVQGPVSGGSLTFVGTLAEFSCRVQPALCGAAPDCAPITSWTVGANVCTPNAGQNQRIAEGAVYTFIDSIGPTLGATTLRCSGGSLVAAGNASCEVQAAGCDTSAVRWTVGGNECTPNANEPRTIASGNSYTFTDSVGSSGRATFSCSDGVLSGPANPSCSPPPPVNCVQPANLSWTVNDNVCVADPATVPVTVADGGLARFIDSRGVPNGVASFRCVNGTLLPEGNRACLPNEPIYNSFGEYWIPTSPGGPGDDGGPTSDGSAADGTAADGAPIVGGSVRIVDRNGRVATATTDSRGYWSATTTGMVPPLLVTVRRPDGRIRHSVSVRTLRLRGFTFIAVTGLTDKIVSDLAAAAEFTSPSAVTPTIVSRLGDGVVADKIVALRNHPVVRPLLQSSGLNPDTFDPLNTPFRANGTGYDRVLDNVVADTNADGSIEIRPILCTVTQLSWSVNGNTCSFSGTLIQLTWGSQLNFQDNEGPTRGSALFACQRGVMVGPSNATCSVVP